MKTGKKIAPRIHLVNFVFVLVALLVFHAQSVKADPLFFSNVVAVQNQSTQVGLASNSGVTLIGPQITFFVDISGTLGAGATDTLKITYTETGSQPIIQTFSIPLFGSVQPPFTLPFTINSIGATPQGISATLTLDLLNSSPDFIIPFGANQGQQLNSYTYSFNVAQPVAEPTTIVGIGSGLFVFSAWRLRLSAYRRLNPNRQRGSFS